MVSDDDLDPVEDGKRRRIDTCTIQDGAKSLTMVESLGIDSVPVCRKKTGTMGNGIMSLRNYQGIKRVGGGTYK